MGWWAWLWEAGARAGRRGTCFFSADFCVRNSIQSGTTMAKRSTNTLASASVLSDAIVADVGLR